ncbi:DRTGG domain-containing protein [Psychrobacillus psychrodurans]|uniref:DRTGG domain-containing protein n=1 Tax=Psychrobacillus psychrodurans TaxID=126157 RepID=UPI0008E72F17|nr:DRTGG domain-containing protein [Psychrobacillus psychrodurans]MCZ8541785.1 DRTGG domain-containing protein [Psychrobacillus psychrodurans]SFN01390.1 Predicted transcriptional regulator containing CBS domains [Psychrobacillus psychrodurans]
MTTKHEQILAYIEKLPVGDKISVRQIAKDLTVSEGTAYRAIKEAETRRLVSTIERVGTIRIELKKKEHFERLTYAEVVNIVDGQVLGGKTGLHKTLNKFVIGAMQLEDMMRYVEPSNLLIAGNRLKVHETALQAGAAVLVTGGVDVTESTKRLADELELPVISTSYDTFTVATMINRAIDDQLIKKDVLLIEDIYVPLQETSYLYATDQVKQYRVLNDITTHGVFPVVDASKKLVGIITARDVIGKSNNEPIEKVMTKNPISVTMKTSVSSASHRMIWEGVDLLPVVRDTNYLEGVISRQDVLKALQAAARQPQNGETIDDIVKQQIKIISTEDYIFEFVVTPQMTDHYGAMSNGAFTILVTETGAQTLKIRKRGESVVENMTIYYTKPIQLESILRIQARVLELSRKVAKMDIEIFNDKLLVGKAMVTYQLLER